MTPCIESTRTPSQRYPQIVVDGRVRGEHRVVWERAHGPIPDGMVVCHHCDNTRCIRLDHLFLGTTRDNAQDAIAKGRYRSQKLTHCPSGHPYDETNTQWVRRSSGRPVERQCKACLLARKREWRKHRREQGLRVT